MDSSISKSPLFSALRKAMKMAMSSDEIIENMENKERVSRRDFLSKSLGISLLSLGVSTNLFDITKDQRPKTRHTSNSKKSAEDQYRHFPRIVIIGGGIAGLNALHTLKKAGLEASLYESSGRTGGRMFTSKEIMGTGTWTEMGGEFIDTNHREMWDLAEEFDLDLLDIYQESELQYNKETFYFENSHHTMSEVVEAFRGFADRIKLDADSLPKTVTFKSKEETVIKLDHVSISEYLTQIGATGWIKSLIEVAFEAEYGLGCQEQSCINLLELISSDTKDGSLELFGDSDERYKVVGGNQSIPDALAKKYSNHIHTYRTLESIRHKSKHYELHFSGTKEAIKADFVLLTIPFTRLRQVDIRVHFPQWKWNAINQLGYGTNGKLMLGMKSHFWRDLGYAGLVFSDNGIQNCWDNAQLQTDVSAAAGLTVFLGGQSAIAMGKGSVDSQKDLFLPKLNQIYPGSTEQFSSKVARMNWHSYAHNLGSYTCYKTGQYTSIAGAEALPVGNIYFAGEHCGGAFSGFMNGAALSGRLAAQEIITKIG
jgi:monoamine oxidase